MFINLSSHVGHTCSKPRKPFIRNKISVATGAGTLISHDQYSFKGSSLSKKKNPSQVLTMEQQRKLLTRRSAITESSPEDTVLTWMASGCANELEPDSTQRTFLHWAAEDGYLKIVLKLLDKYKPLKQFQEFIDQPDRNHQTALHLAAKNGHVDIVKALMKAGASLELPDKFNFTASGMAAHHYHAEVFELLEAGILSKTEIPTALLPATRSSAC